MRINNQLLVENELGILEKISWLVVTYKLLINIFKISPDMGGWNKIYISDEKLNLSVFIV